MSRGLGKWQRLLYDATQNQGRPHGLYVRGWLKRHVGREPTAAEITAVHRAARGLVRRGLVSTRCPNNSHVDLLVPEEPTDATV